MTVVIETPSTNENARTHPFQGRGRWFAAAVVVAGGALQTAEFLLEPAADSNTERVHWWLAHPLAMQLSQAVGLLAVPCLVAALVVYRRLCQDSSRRLSAVAVGMLLSAMVGLAAVHGVELAARWVAVQGHPQAAVGILGVQDPGLPGIALVVMFLPMAAIGSLLLAVAMWRSPYVPRLAAAFVLAFLVLDFAGGLGLVSHASALAGDLVLAWAIVAGHVRGDGAARTLRAG